MREIILGLAALLMLTDMARAGERVALLIGNAAYGQAVFDLLNPARDATALAAALRPLGFTTRVLIDADREEAEAALATFAERAAGAEIAFFFFAGHGTQINGENRLLTSDFAGGGAAEIARDSLPLDTVRAALTAAKPELGVIVLDACRDNPLAAGGAGPRGLARARGGLGQLIAYATDPGNVAFDGTGPDSVFTTALLDNIATPGLDIRLMFGRVRQSVVLATGGRQVPWVEEAVIGDPMLNPAPPAITSDGIDADMAAWRAATAAGDLPAFRAYLDTHPTGLFRAFAEERLARPSEPGAESDAGAVLAAADPATVADALATLGFLSRTRGGPAPDAAALDAAFASYASQMAGPRASLDGLYLDAAQMTVMLAAATAQRLRAQLAAFAGLSIILRNFQNDRPRAAGKAAEGVPGAREALLELDAAIADVGAKRERVQKMLDQSRERYADLVAAGGHDFRPYLTRALAGFADASRGMPEADTAMMADAARFVRHADDDGTTRPEGSMRWLADFLPGG